MDKKLNNSLQTAWEILNGAIYDLTEGNKEDALGAVEECRDVIEGLLETDAVLDAAVEQIKSDLAAGDTTAIHELLKFVPLENLQAFISEEDAA